MTLAEYNNILLQTVLAIYLAASLGLLIYGLNAYVLMGLHLHSRAARKKEERDILERFALGDDHSRYPMITTQLPIYNEHNVVERLLRAVCAFDYPADKHEIQVLDDSTDDTSELVAQLVTELREAGHDVHHVRRIHRRGFKAGALAAGLKSARGEFVAIFDADFVPPADFLLNTVPYLIADDRCCFVQTRWGHRNRRFSLLTELQSIGIDGHFVVEQSARAWNNLFFNFNGTAGVWRIAAIEDAGGWKADTLTEDLDLSYRALLAGWRPRYLLDTVTPAEIPTDINALKSQQRRWATGSIQCAMKMLPRVLMRRDLSFVKKIQAALHLTHYMIHPFILILTLLALPLVRFLQPDFDAVFTAPLIGVMLLAMLGPSSLYVLSQVVTGRGWRRTVMLMPLLIAMGIGLAVNNSVAVAKALLGLRGGEFVRTPKLGDLAENSGHSKTEVLTAYRQPLSRLFIFELCVGLWSLGSFLIYLVRTGSAGGVFLLVQAVGFSLVGILSVRHHRHHNRALPAKTSS